MPPALPVPGLCLQASPFIHSPSSLSKSIPLPLLDFESTGLLLSPGAGDPTQNSTQCLAKYSLAFDTTVAFIFLLVVSLTSVPLTCCKECLLKLRVLQTVKISNLVSLFDAKCYNPGTVCENVTFQDMTQCSFIEVNQCYRGMYCLHHCLDDGGSTNV
jgi:hypothetical protein